MILHLTAGSTHIALEIDVADCTEPRISVLPEQLTLPPPTVRSVRRRSPRLLTLAAVAAVAAFGGYRFAPGSSGSQTVMPAQAQTAYVVPSRVPADDPAQIPAQLRRELAGRPVITAPPATSTPGKPGDGNPFGLD